MNEGFPRDATNKLDSLCLVRSKVEPSRRPEQDCVLRSPKDRAVSSVISTTSLNPNQSLQEPKS